MADGKGSGEFVLRGTQVDGPEFDLVELAGLKLTDAQQDALWGEVSPGQLLVEDCACDEVEVDRSDGGPGQSDIWYEYHCGPRDAFIATLRAAILARVA